MPTAPEHRSPSAAAPWPVYLVGAGPGDPELLTLRAVGVLRQATVALVDDLVNPGCLRHLADTCRVVSVGKRGGCASTPQAFIERLLVAEALRGERVVRLKGGDPLVFGRAGEEIAALRAAGIAVEVVPGITAGVAAAASAGVSLTHRNHAPGVAFVTGHRRPGGEAPRWDVLAQSGLTLVVYMGMAEAHNIRSGLLAGGLAGDTPVLLVQAASSAGERRVATRLCDLQTAIAAEQLSSPCVMIVGDAMMQVLQNWTPVENPAGVQSATGALGKAA